MNAHSRTQDMNAIQRTDAVQLFEPEQNAVFSIEAAARITHTPRHNILVYCKNHLVSPVTDPVRDGFFFDTDAIDTLRRIEFLRSDCGVNLAGIKMILRLANEVERLREDLDFQTL